MDPNMPNNQNPFQSPGAPAVPPAWGQPTPTKSGGVGAAIGGLFRSVVGRIVGVVLVLVILGGAGIVYYKVANPDHLSQLIFTSTDQTVNDGCSVTNRVSSVKTGDHVYVMVMWSRRLSATDAVTEEDFKDGVSIYKSSTDWSASDYAGYDCSVDSTDYSELFKEPGTYEIKLTVGTEVVADGTLAVTK